MYSLNFTSERLALFVCKPKAAKSSINLVAQRKRNYEHKRAQCVRNAVNKLHAAFCSLPRGCKQRVPIAHS